MDPLKEGKRGREERDTGKQSWQDGAFLIEQRFRIILERVWEGGKKGRFPGD